jgi:predicted DNA-binding transcriptional regulator YafY
MRYERSLAITSRHERLIELIRSGEFSSRNLAEELEVSEQTIYRDIDFLKGRGYSIRSVRLSWGWAYQLLGERATVPNGKGS